MTPHQQLVAVRRLCEHHGWEWTEVAGHLVDGPLADLAIRNVPTNGGDNDAHPSRPDQSASPPPPKSKWAQVVAGPSVGYSPDKFYCQSSDVKGHGNTVSVKLPPEVLRDIQILIADGAFPPYRLPSDFIRDATHHWLHYRSEQIGDPKVQKELAELFVLRDLEEQAAVARSNSRRWSDLRTEISDICTVLARDGAWRQVADYLAKTETAADSAPDPYRGTLRADIEQWQKKLPDEFR